VPRLELLRALEEADDGAVSGIRRHAVPGFRGKDRRAGPDDPVEPRGHRAIRLRHRGDLREHFLFAVLFLPAGAARVLLLLPDALLHRGAFLIGESLGRPTDRAGAPGGLLRRLHVGSLESNVRRLARAVYCLTMHRTHVYVIRAPGLGRHLSGTVRGKLSRNFWGSIVRPGGVHSPLRARRRHARKSRHLSLGSLTELPPCTLSPDRAPLPPTTLQGRHL